MLLLAEELRRQNLTPALGLGLVFMADEESGSDYGLAHVLEQAPELFRPDDLYVVPDADLLLGAGGSRMPERAERLDARIFAHGSVLAFQPGD